MQKKLQNLAWIVIVFLGLYILYRGFMIAKENHFLQRIPGIGGLERALETMAVKTHMPGLSFAWQGPGEPKEWTDFALDEVFPLYSYAQQEAKGLPDIESRLEYELMMEVESQTEALAKLPESEGRKPETEQRENPMESPTETQTEGQTERKPEIEAKDPKRQPEVDINEEELRDYNYLLNNFFTVDPSTTALESQINYNLLMSKDLKMTSDNSAPQILIYHTHSQEAFVDSVEGDVNDTVVGVGNYLTEILTNVYGYNVIHHTKVYDMIDGELDRNKAYTLAAPDIQQILDENPSIEVVIDLHRDGVDGYKFVQEINGKPTAQIMFFNGLSRTARNGEIDYLPNPYIEDNLAFSFQLQLKAAQYYPGWTRNIYLQSLRYNLHMCPKSLLIESGTQLNTVQEERNAMELLADILNQVLRGE